MTSVSGLSGSGLDINSIITSLMAVERRTQDAVAVRQSDAKTQLSTVQSIKAKITDLKNMALKTAKPSDWNVLKGTSSDDTAVSVTAGSTGTPSSLSFSVFQLATAGALRSQNTVAA